MPTIKGTYWRWPAMGFVLGSACVIAIAAVRSAPADPIPVPTLPKPIAVPAALAAAPPVISNAATPIPVIPPALPTTTPQPVQTGLVTIPTTPPVPVLAAPPVIPSVQAKGDPTPAPAPAAKRPLPQGGIEIPGLVAPPIVAGAADSQKAPKPTLPELAPPPTLVPSTKSPAPPARPSQPAKTTQPIPSSSPEFNLRSADPGLSVNKKDVEPVVPQASKTTTVVQPTPMKVDASPTDTKIPRRELQPTPTPPGDSAMTLPSRQTVLSAACGLALAVAPMRPIAAQEAPATPATPAPTLTATEIDGLKRDLKQLQADIKRLDEQRLAMDKSLFDKKTNGLGADGLSSRVDALELKVQALQSTLNRVEDRLDQMSKTTVGSSPLNNTPPPAAVKGNVRIVNEYQTEISMVINGFSYRLTPGQVQTVPVPAGSYTYELLGAGSKSQTSNIKEGETITLRIR